MFLEVLHELSDRRCTATISEMHEFTEQEPAARDLEAVGDEASFRELVGSSRQVSERWQANHVSRQVPKDSKCLELLGAH